MASYATAFPATWLQQPAVTNVEENTVNRQTQSQDQAGTDVITRDDDDDSIHTASSLHMEEMSDLYYSDEEGDPTAKLEAAGIRTRDFATFPLSTPLRTSALPDTPSQELQPGLQTVGKRPESIALQSPPTILPMTTATLSNRPISTYASELPQSWLQQTPISPSVTTPAVQPQHQNVTIRHGRTAGQRTPVLHRTDDPSDDLQSRGSQGDVVPYNPGRRTYTIFENRHHLDYNPARNSSYSAKTRNNKVTSQIIQPTFEADRPTSNTSLTSTYSDADTGHGSRHSSGDMPPRYPRYGYSRDSTTST